jgi:hypothetical protein
MILTAHQPCYMPWLGLFNKIELSNQFCFFDIVQYQRKDFNNRNKIISDKKPSWLNVPVNDSNRFDKKINEIKISGDIWKKKHLKTIYLSYKKTEFFENYFDSFSKILQKKFIFLVDLNFELTLFFLECLNIKTNIIKASDFDFTGKKSDLVLDMCLKLDAKKYIFGSQGKKYADLGKFKENNIDIVFQNYEHPKYNQRSINFYENMSIIDLLFNEGPNSKKILMKNNENI